MSYYAPLDEMVPSSYCLTKITSTKSRGAMIPIAAEGVTVRQIEMSCARVGDKGMYSKTELNKAKSKMGITSGITWIYLKLHWARFCFQKNTHGLVLADQIQWQKNSKRLKRKITDKWIIDRNINFILYR